MIDDWREMRVSPDCIQDCSPNEAVRNIAGNKEISDLFVPPDHPLKILQVRHILYLMHSARALSI